MKAAGLRSYIPEKQTGRPWFEHSDIANGGTLTFEMGSHPNRAWGSSPQAAPPSMSQETNIQ
jgi:putative alpha-1,2-mannosidase